MPEAARIYEPQQNLEENFFVGKVGGANISRLHLVRDYIKHQQREGKEIYLVLSAFKHEELGGVTDALVNAYNLCVEPGSGFDENHFNPVWAIHEAIINEYIPENESPTEHQAAQDHYDKEIKKVKEAFEGGEMNKDQLRDYVIGAGERMACGIAEIYLEKEGINANFIGDVVAGEGEDQHERMKNGLKNKVEEAYAEENRSKVAYLVAGHIQTKEGAPRGYSDLAVILLGSVIAEIKGLREIIVNLLKNIDAIASANPAELAEAEKGKVINIIRMALAEVIQLGAASDAGAEVVQMEAAQALLRENKVSMCIRNIASPEKEGTLVVNSQEKISTERPFKVVASQKNVQGLFIEDKGMVGMPGYTKTILEIFKQKQLSYNLSLESKDRLCFTFRMPKDPDKRSKYEDQIAQAITAIGAKLSDSTARVEHRKGLATVSAVGSEVDGRLAGILKRILAAKGIKILGTSQMKGSGVISYLIQENDRQEAISAFHEALISNRSRFNFKVVASDLIEGSRRILGLNGDYSDLEITPSKGKAQAILIRDINMIGQSGYAEKILHVFESRDLSYDFNFESGNSLCYIFTEPNDPSELTDYNKEMAAVLAELRSILGLDENSEVVKCIEDLATVSISGKEVEGKLPGIIKRVLAADEIEILSTSHIEGSRFVPYLVREKDKDKAVNILNRVLAKNELAANLRVVAKDVLEGAGRIFGFKRRKERKVKEAA